MFFALSVLIAIVMKKLVDEGIEEFVTTLGVKGEMENLQRTIEITRLVLVDAESKKIESNSIALWLAELRELMYDAEDLLDDFAAARDSKSESAMDALRNILRHSQLTCDSLKTRINKMNSTLGRITSETSILQLLASQPNAGKKVCAYNSSRIADTCSIQLDSEIIGIDDDTRDLVDRITGDSNRVHSVFAITGMGGSGKTTLARKVFDQIGNHFEKKFWVCVSSNCNGEYLLKEIVRFFDKNYSDSGVSLNELSSKVFEVVYGWRVFIVLDDIWDIHVWEKFLRVPLYAAAKYSRILITTRNQQVAMKMNAAHTHPMKSMLPDDGWSMLCKIVFKGEDNGYKKELADVGKKIVDKCKGLPLAIKVVGGVLKTTDRTIAAWTRVLSNRTWSMRTLPEDVLPSLLLSYEDLPSHMKQCFIYCSLFPKDFEFSRVKLVYMWIAEGFVKKEEGMKKEESAEEYYNELVMRNLLQVIPPLDGSKCKMHDLIRSLALFVSQNQYIYVDPENFRSSGLIRRRHLCFTRDGKNVIPEEIMKLDYVRTLILSGNPQVKEISPDVFGGLRRLRILDMGMTGIKTLPDSLGNLIQLRFLNISSTEIKELPDSIENLKNLQTLIVDMFNLHLLPKGIVNLYNLRHLIVSDTLDNMPNRFDYLKNLRVLSCFVVNDCTSIRFAYTPNMKELENLSQLTDLSVYHLERVASKKEAEMAAIEKKTSLKCLKLHCGQKTSISDKDVRKIEEVFAGIEIPENLTELFIHGFFGKQFPNHMTSDRLSQVNSLKLEDCTSLSQLPFLGRMPNLETLHIKKLSSVTELSSESLGSLKFPKLQELELYRMENLKRMFEVKEGAFPCLVKLLISDCPKLKSLGEGLQHATCLKKMTVRDLDGLESIENLSSISELEICRNKMLESVKNLTSLKKMKIKDCGPLKNVERVGKLNSLSISYAEMETLPSWLLKTTAPKKLKLKVSEKLVLKTKECAEVEEFIRKCCYVDVGTKDKSKWMSYRKDHDLWDSNMPGSSDAS